MGEEREGRGKMFHVALTLSGLRALFLQRRKLTSAFSSLTLELTGPVTLGGQVGGGGGCLEPG